MKIRLLESITLRSAPLAAGQELELSDLDAHQLITAGQAAPVAPAPAAPVPAPNPNKSK